MKNFKKIVSFLFIFVLIFSVSMPVEAATKISKTKLTLYVGQTSTLKVTGTSKKVKWTSSNKIISTVSDKGKVTAKKAGRTNITAKVNGKKYTCKVTVKDPYLNKTSHTLAVGKSYTLKITGTQAKSWESSDKQVATVSSKGKVTAKKAGTATITCKGKNGKSYQCTITVMDDKAAEDKRVYEKMIAQKKNYPEGRPWTNSNFYRSKCGTYGGYGCVAFAFILSDAAFDDAPARMHTDFSKIRVGDIVRMNNNTHTVVILEIKSDSVILAEGNYNSSIHWGREVSLWAINHSNYVITRYPEE